jgi:imidazoleglycerol phosphate dehydratase HisB
MTRRAEISRETSETTIECRLDLDGNGSSEIKTGLGFLDHMITTLAKHGRFDLSLLATGDTDVDDHHTVEDCAMVLGRAINEALGDRAGITRFGYSYAPLDESLSRAVVDLSGRPWPEVELSMKRDAIGDVASENLTHFFRTLAIEARMALHVDVIRGDNDHHKAESAFKAVAIALRIAVGVTGAEVPSTKGSLV